MTAKYLLPLALLSAIQGNPWAAVAQQLAIGDTVPDMDIRLVGNGSEQLTRLSEEKSPLVILDFWDKTCKSCIASLPKIEKLEELFKGRLKVIVVTKNSQGELEPYFEKSPVLRETKLPFLMSDTTLHGLFPPTSLPFYVWMDRERRVLYRTGPQHLTEYWIGKVLEGQRIDIEDTQLNRKLYDTSLFSLHGDTVQTATHRSVFMENIANATPIFSVKRDGRNAIGLKYVNCPLLDMVMFAYGFPYEDRMLWADTALFKQRRQLYSYESSAPGASIAQLRAFLKADLGRFVNLEASVRNLPTPCAVLTRTRSDGREFASRRPAAGRILETTARGEYFLVNYTFQTLLNNLGHLVCSEGEVLPFLDETDFDGKIDLQLSIGNGSLECLNRSLGKYGLELQRTVRNVDMLVVDALAKENGL